MSDPSPVDRGHDPTVTEAVNPELFRALEGRSTQPVTEEALLFWRQAAQSAPALPPPAPQLTAVDLLTEQAGRVRTYVVNPDPQGEGKPAVLDLHGGGFVLGTGDARPAYLQEIAMRTGAVVISPEYRLAPEHPFPAALEDCAAVLSSVQRNAAEYRIDPRRIAVSGGSAGGGHAAMLCLAERGRSLHPIAFQLLVQPMLDDRTAVPVPLLPTSVIWCGPRSPTDSVGRPTLRNRRVRPRRRRERFPRGRRSWPVSHRPGSVSGRSTCSSSRTSSTPSASRPQASRPRCWWCPAPTTASTSRHRMPSSAGSSTAAYVAAFRRGLGLPPEVRETSPLGR